VKPKAQSGRAPRNTVARFTLLVAASLALTAACSFGVDNYTLAPADPCAAGCVPCSAVANQLARPSCLCGTQDAGACPTQSSVALFGALAACAAQRCPIECGVLVDAGPHASGSGADCTACADTQCKDTLTACLMDTSGCPH
jgi:hypothetical protein